MCGAGSNTGLDSLMRWFCCEHHDSLFRFCSSLTVSKRSNHWLWLVTDSGSNSDSRRGWGGGQSSSSTFRAGGGGGVALLETAEYFGLGASAHSYRHEEPGPLSYSTSCTLGATEAEASHVGFFLAQP